MEYNAISEQMQKTLLGVYAATPRLLQERNEVNLYYTFFGGPARYRDDLLNECSRGQSWLTSGGLDYTPSQDIRNHVKKLLQKQARFMFGNPPNVLLKPLNKKDKDNAEQKRMIIDKIFDDANFWGQTAKAFLDCTIGKRVLLAVEANPNSAILFRYYTMQEFTYKTDPNDFSKLTEVIIAYMDGDTCNKQPAQQVWHRWKYYMDNGACWVQAGTYDGNAVSWGDETLANTLLDELPCRVILNGGLTGDVEGESDVRELLDLQNAYNQVTSDYRDALKFKMFEQPVFIDADSDSLKLIKIAPNAIIDLKTDPATESGRADAKMLSSTFSFTTGADSYLDRIKADLYELMDQPRPEDLRSVPSAKALRFMFYDLMARCDEKWQEWSPAVKWVIKMMCKCIDQFNLYPELQAKSMITTATNIVIEHNYPIPEDDDIKREIAIKEVAGNVRSHKTYIRDFSVIEDEDGEWQEILAEQGEINAAVSDQFTTWATQDLAGAKDSGATAGGATGANGGTGKATDTGAGGA